jgi:ankyrin repeat protein
MTLSLYHQDEINCISHQTTHNRKMADVLGPYYMRRITPLHKAIVNGDVEAVRRLLSESDTDVDATQTNGGWLVDFYLDNKGNICVGWTPLMTAIYKGNAEIVEILLKAGAKVDADNCVGWPPLHCAVEHGRTEIMEILLKDGAKVDTIDNGGRTPLHYAARNGNAEIVEILLKAGAKVDAIDKKGKTPLHRAARYADAKIVEILLKAGANPFMCDNAGKTAAVWACTKDIKDRLEAVITAAVEKIFERLHPEKSNVIATLVTAPLFHSV